MKTTILKIYDDNNCDYAVSDFLNSDISVQDMADMVSKHGYVYYWEDDHDDNLCFTASLVTFCSYISESDWVNLKYMINDDDDSHKAYSQFWVSAEK